MFDDVDEVINAEVRKRRRWCGFTRWTDTLSPEDRVRAEELVFGREYDCRSLARYFETKGAKINDQVLSRHRNQRCCQAD